MYNGELLISIGILGLLIYGLFEKEINSLMLLTYVLAIFLMFMDPLINLSGIEVNMLSNNYYLSLIKIVILLAGIPFLFNPYKFEFTILLTTSLLGMLLLVSSSNLLAIYLALELQSLSAYLLAAYHKDSKESTEAGLKYFVLGALASGLILFGISLVYGFTGLINLEDIKLLEGIATGAILGSIFLVVGLLFKLAAVPFHGWVPDVYEGAPTHVTAFFATLPKIALLIMLIKILNVGFYGAINTWQSLITISAGLSIIIGSLGALYQTKIKRLLAYSTIANVGFILIGVATGTIEGLEAAIVYTLIYMVTNLGIFTIILCIKKDNFKLLELQNLGSKQGLIAISLIIFLFSTAGLPPLAGFIGKLEILMSAISEEMYVLVLIAIVMSVISTAYYIRLVQIMYFQDKEYVLGPIEMSLSGKITLGISLGIILSLILKPNKLLELSHELVLSLL